MNLYFYYRKRLTVAVDNAELVAHKRSFAAAAEGQLGGKSIHELRTR